MTAHLYRMKCLTNLHVGGGDVNYGLIDNQVEKDPVLESPVIHSTGVKGALRAYFERLWTDNAGKERVASIFGSPVGESDKKGTRPGSYRFLDASLLARPLRISNIEGTQGDSFALATSEKIINVLVTLLEGLGIDRINNTELHTVDTQPEKNSFWKFDASQHATEIEGCKVELKQDAALLATLGALIGTKQAVLTDNLTLRDFALPILVHNQLEDGESKNLFYEEVVPHQSVFLLPILTPGKKDELELHGKTVQIGSGASLGYGLMELTKVV